jgi:rhodanese-related sulfurtransferase
MCMWHVHIARMCAHAHAVCRRRRRSRAREVLAMAWRSYNLLMNEPRVLVLDARSSSSFASGHIRGSFCVCLLHARASSSSSPLHYVAGPPVWSRNCWWDRHVLLILPPSCQDRKRKKPSSSSSAAAAAAAAATPFSCQHPVLTFLKQEGLVRSLHVLENDDSHDGNPDTSSSLFIYIYI